MNIQQYRADVVNTINSDLISNDELKFLSTILAPLSDVIYEPTITGAFTNELTMIIEHKLGVISYRWQ